MYRPNICGAFGRTQTSQPSAALTGRNRHDFHCGAGEKLFFLVAKLSTLFVTDVFRF